VARRVGLPQRAEAKPSRRVARRIAAFIEMYSTPSNADRAEMGITVRDTSSSPAPAPTKRPLALVESGQRLTHQLRPGAAPRSEPDESTPPRRARTARIQNPRP